MRVMRGKTFEGKSGVWEKIEVELETQDLLPEETAAAQQVHISLLEVRAEKHLIQFLVREGKIAHDEGKARLHELNEYKKTLLAIKPKKIIQRRGSNSDTSL